MPDAVYQVMTRLRTLVTPLPIGTNLGLLHLLWMLVSGRRRATCGAVIPGLREAGLTDAQVRRAWAVRGHGTWTRALLLRRWRRAVAQAGRWQPPVHGG